MTSQTTIPLLPTLTALALTAACTDVRSHAELMADAAADVEAIQLERAMARFDSARTATPDDAEAHRQYALLAAYFDLYAKAADAWERVLELEPSDAAAWDGYFGALRWAGIHETDRRYGEKVLQILPDALRTASQRPELYSNAQGAAQDLGELEAYGAMLMDHREAEADNPVFLHHLAAAQAALADLGEGDRSRELRDSLGAVLDELAARHKNNNEAEAPTLYQLAAGYNLLREEDEKDFWLSRLLAAPDRGILADYLRYWDLALEFQTLLYGPSASELMDELFRVVDEGFETAHLGRRAAWVSRRVSAVRALASQSVAGESTLREEPVSMAAEPSGPALAPEYAESLFGAVIDQIAWQSSSPVSALSGLLYYGIQPQRVLEEAINLETALRSDRPGYLYPGNLGEERERSRRSMITSARVLQARARAQLGETEAAGELFEELAAESPGSQTLAQFGRHLVRTNQPERALNMLVEALAHGGDWRQAAAEAAMAAGLPTDVVEKRLAVRRPIVQAELERTALGERLELKPPDLVLTDQNGVEWALRDLTGKVVVLKFWATWCAPCLQEFPHFVKQLENYEDDDGIVFLTVATAGSPREAVAQLLSENGYTFPVLLDDEGQAVDFEILGYPTTFYLDPDGLIQFKREGFYEAGYERQTAIRIDALRAGGGLRAPTQISSRLPTHPRPCRKTPAAQTPSPKFQDCFEALNGLNSRK